MFVCKMSTSPKKRASFDTIENPSKKAKMTSELEMAEQTMNFADPNVDADHNEMVNSNDDRTHDSSSNQHLSDPLFLSTLNRYCCVGFPCLHFSILNEENTNVTNPSVSKDVGIVSGRRGRHFGDHHLDRGYSTALARNDDEGVEQDDLGLDAQPQQILTMTTYQELIRQYNEFCDLYNCPPNAGILVAIRFRLPTLRVSSGDSFHDADVLALVELLLHNDNCNRAMSYIRRLDFSVANAKRYGRRFKGFGSHGAFALSKVIQKSQYLEELFMSRNRIGPYGAAAIFLAASTNTKLRTIVMRKCQISSQGALAFTQHILCGQIQISDKRQCGLKQVDLSCNRMGHIGIKIIQDSQKLHNANVQEHNQIEIDLDGNLVFQEILNGITHGVGIILVVFGAVVLSRRVKDKSLRHVLSCAIYNFSLLLLYTSSTLYHSFFYLKLTRDIFHVFDRCAIYILIAGTYTPVLVITFPTNIWWSGYMLSFIWICGICGICVDASAPTWKYKGQFSLVMYLCMGWASMMVLPDCMQVWPQGTSNLIVLGGLLYTAGVPFFVRNTNLDHTVWHCFVLAASISHWMAVYQYIVHLP